MKKCLIALVLSVLLGLFIPINIPASLITTLFTVAGVMFSVGMSMVVTMSTQNIHNRDAKSMVQDTIKRLIGNYIFCFIILTLCFAVSMLFKIDNEDAFTACQFALFGINIHFNYPFAIFVYSIYSVFYYTYNMWATRNQNYEIECKIDEEMNDD